MLLLKYLVYFVYREFTIISKTIINLAGIFELENSENRDFRQIVRILLPNFFRIKHPPSIQKQVKKVQAKRKGNERLSAALHPRKKQSIQKAFR